MRCRFALDEQGSLIDIRHLGDSGRRRYHRYNCPGCGRIVFPVLGKIREHHFRHKTEADGGCSNESYLHHVAKTKIFENYKRALAERRPFYLKLPVKRVCSRWQEQFQIECRLQNRVEKIDLTQHFDVVELEGSVAGFRADILLKSSRSDACLLVEVAVSHWCEETKVNSGLRILEATVTDEGDVESLSECFNVAESGLFSTYNFRERDVEEGRCHSRCGAKTAVFRVFDSGKAHIQSCHPAGARKLIAQESVRYWRVVPEAAEWTEGFLAGRGWDREAKAAAAAGAPIRNCCLCRYAGFQTTEHPIFCKILKKEVGHNYAADCEMYRQNQHA